MQRGLMVEPQTGGSYQQLADLASWAETNGFHSFARSDHYLNMSTSEPATDALTSIGGLAISTNTIKLTVLVSPITFRHPGVIAKTASTLNEMSGGRFELGIGTGWMQGEHDAFGIALPPLGERFDRFEEALGYLWSAFGRSSPGYSGSHFQLADDLTVLPVVGTDVPIVIGGSGMKRTPTLAGRFADEYNMFATDTETLSKRLDVMRNAAQDAGRNPDEITVSIAVSPVLGADEAEYRALLSAKAADRDVTVDEYTAMLDERNIPHGTAERFTEALAKLQGGGVGRVYLQQFSSLADIDRNGVLLAASAIDAL